MKCLKCHGETIRHDGKQDDCRDEDIGCISVNHDEREVWFICQKCCAYHLQCPKCNLYCRLTGFPGEKKSPDNAIDGRQFHIVDGTYVPFDGDFYDTFEDGCVPIPKEMNVYYLDGSEWYPTGADGSKHLVWECTPCLYKVVVVD